MRSIVWRLKSVALAIALAVGMTSVAVAQDYDPYWGDSAHDEQRWWNPADWFDDTEMTNDWDWDYDYSWNDYDGYDGGYERKYSVDTPDSYLGSGQGGASDPFEYDYDYYGCGDDDWDDVF